MLNNSCTTQGTPLRIRGHVVLFSGESVCPPQPSLRPWGRNSSVLVEGTLRAQWTVRTVGHEVSLSGR